MIAGRLKYKLELLRPVQVRSAFGSDDMEYEVVAVAHAERVRISGNRSEELGEHFADYRAVFNIRKAHPISENWRVRQLGGNLYTVTNVIPFLDRGFNQLVCERVNE